MQRRSFFKLLAAAALTTPAAAIAALKPKPKLSVPWRNFTATYTVTADEVLEAARAEPVKASAYHKLRQRREREAHEGLCEAFEDMWRQVKFKPPLKGRAISNRVRL